MGRAPRQLFPRARCRVWRKRDTHYGVCPALVGAAGVASFASSALSERLEEKPSCAIRAASARSWSAGRKRDRALTRRKTRWVREASYRVSASQNANARVTRFVTSKLKLTVTAEVISQPSIATRYRNLDLGAAIWAAREEIGRAHV